jgi:plasmid stabilization system protein ParE
LSGAYDNIETDYRLLVCNSYLAFYHLQGKEVFIDRILHARRDYITILFGEIPQDKTDR